MYAEYNTRLFELNVRAFLGVRGEEDRQRRFKRDITQGARTLWLITMALVLDRMTLWNSPQTGWESKPLRDWPFRDYEHFSRAELPDEIRQKGSP
jgi:hypothetical protein